jgi:MEDS: MEthanogen/methylotroph, DcmR Sensory domain
VRGASGSNSGRLPHVHLCRVVNDHAAFRETAVAFLADGLARGLRVRYVAAGDDDALRAELAPLQRLPAFHRPGAVEVQSVGGAYLQDTPALPPVDEQVAVWAGACAAALADGFAGFRAAADCTPLVHTPEQLEAFARYEHQIDRLMTTLPLSGLCGYRRAELDEDVLTQLACLHPGGDPAPFRVHAVPDADVAVSGELDITTVDLFATTLDRTGVPDAAAELVVDATALTFTDHRNLLVLEHLAHRHDRSVVLRTGRRWPERLVAALELTRVRVERVA